MTGAVAILVLGGLAAVHVTTVVAHGESLAAIASRELGESDAASELAAINGLVATDAPKKGTRIALPGPERTRAVSAIRATQAAMRDANSEEGRKAAQAELDRAWESLRAARYDEAAVLAEGAGTQLVNPTTRVSVVVDPGQAGTRFLVQSGTVEVSSDGASRVATAGNLVLARAGSAPRLVREIAPPTPSLLEPADGAEVPRAAMQWVARATGGARPRYRVLVARDATFHERVFSADVDGATATAPLEDGVFFWRVQAVAENGGEGVPTLARSFTLKRPTSAPTVNVGKPVFGGH